MALSRNNPIAIAVVPQLETDLAGEVNELHRRIEQADNARQEWVARQDRLVKQRRGVRSETRYPWVGAANDNWPLTDAVIRRWKPGIVSLVLGADPVAWFRAMSPEDVEPARAAQAFYHWMFNTGIKDVHKTVLELADLIAQYGLAYTRQGWLYRTARTCRIIQAESLFPGGVQAAYEAFANGVVEAAAAEGVPVDSSQLPSLEEYIKNVIREQYGLDDEEDAADAQQMEQAVAALLQDQKYIKLYYEHVADDRPDWRVLHPNDVVIPSRACSVEDAEFVCIVHRLEQDQIRRMAIDGLFNPEKAEEVAAKIETRRGNGANGNTTQGAGLNGLNNRTPTLFDELDGITPANTEDEGADSFWEIHAKVDTDGDGLKERVIIWYWPNSPTASGTKQSRTNFADTASGGVILSVIAYPYPFEEWPIVQFEFEHNAARPYSSRGVAELLSTHQKIANRMHNARLDAIAVSLSPAFQMRQSAKDLIRQIRFRPGLIVPVQQMGDIQPLPMDMRPLTGLLQEESYTRNLGEQYVGIFDPGVLNQNSPERRTATEVQAVTGQIQAIFTQDATLFQKSMSKVHNQLWKLWLDFGPEEEYFRVMDEEQPRRATKAEIGRDFDINPAGTPSNTNLGQALASARETLQIVMQDATGILDRHAMYKWFFDLIDRNLSRQIVRPPEEAALIQQLMAVATQATGEQAPPM